ncbi:MAG: hypothetical protein G4V63_27150 [Candidatus Afipia apatlaquensis]|uniref:Uncharacterized protein n=1 Tax=Candidatus Afipia apatlaquensis TaxID=2712852 RepID=A0A7C9VHY7_9BRAD|nr:hypothetical protein [Candidatus Afipia apatlaquensis]
MIERFLEWLRGPKIIIRPEADFDRLADLIERGDPSDPKTFEEIARLMGQTDPERF